MTLSQNSGVFSRKGPTRSQPATLAITYGHVGHSGQLLPLAAFVGGLTAVAAAYILGRSAGSVRAAGALVLAGLTVTLFFTAVQTFVQQQHTNTLRDVYSWLLGGFSTATWGQVAVAAPYVAVSSAAIVLHRRVLDVLVDRLPIKDKSLYDRMWANGTLLYLNPDGYAQTESIAWDHDWLVQQGMTQAPVDLGRVIDNQFVDYALGRLGRYAQ